MRKRLGNLVGGGLTEMSTPWMTTFMARSDSDGIRGVLAWGRITSIDSAVLPLLYGAATPQAELQRLHFDASSELPVATRWCVRALRRRPG